MSGLNDTRFDRWSRKWLSPSFYYFSRYCNNPDKWLPLLMTCLVCIIITLFVSMIVGFEITQRPEQSRAALLAREESLQGYMSYVRMTDNRGDLTFRQYQIMKDKISITVPERK